MEGVQEDKNVGLNYPTETKPYRIFSLRPCLLLRYFYPKRCEDMWGFGVHPILSNPIKYSSPKILYHDGEFFI
jgi:hypothetical protein